MKKNIYGLLLLVMFMMIPTLQVNATDSTNLYSVKDFLVDDLEDMHYAKDKTNCTTVQKMEEIISKEPSYWDLSNDARNYFLVVNNSNKIGDRNEDLTVGISGENITDDRTRPLFTVSDSGELTFYPYPFAYYQKDASYSLSGTTYLAFFKDSDCWSDSFDISDYSDAGSLGNCSTQAFNLDFNADKSSELPEGYIYRICTNIPIFMESDTEAIENYFNNNDTSGAQNADQIENIVNPKDEVTYSNDLKLDKLQYYGDYLDLSAPKERYFEYRYFPEFEGYDLENMCIEIAYRYDYGCSTVLGDNVPITPKTYNFSTCTKLSNCRNGFTVKPLDLLELDSGCVPSSVANNCFGGTIMGKDLDFLGLIGGSDSVIDVNSLYHCNCSKLQLNIRLVCKIGRQVVASSRAYKDVIDLLTGECTSYYADYDEDSGEYVVDDEPYKSTDKNGNTKVNNTVEGGNNSSANGGTGGNATIGDINNNNTIKFPDHITVDLNVNGIVPNNTIVNVGGGSSSSGTLSDSSSGAKLPTFIQNAGNGLSTFMQYLFSGFGMFDSSSGIVQLLQASFPYIPSEYWQVFIFGSAAVVFGSIIAIFFRR